MNTSVEIDSERVPAEAVSHATQGFAERMVVRLLEKMPLGGLRWASARTIMSAGCHWGTVCSQGCARPRRSAATADRQRFKAGALNRVEGQHAALGIARKVDRTIGRDGEASERLHRARHGANAAEDLGSNARWGFQR